MSIRRARRGSTRGNRPPGFRRALAATLRGGNGAHHVPAGIAPGECRATMRSNQGERAQMKKLALIVVVLGAMGYGGYRWLGDDDKPSVKAKSTDGEQLVLDRIWIDHLPKN